MAGMRSAPAAALLVSLFAACDAPEPAPFATASVDGEVREERLRSTVRFLSHDLLEGRGVGARGDSLARLYLATRMERAGLKPANGHGGFEQPVPIVGIQSIIKSPLSVRSDKGEESFTAPADYVAFAGRPDARTQVDGAEIVFVGYGISAPEQDWDDFGGFDCAGKVLLVMNNDPSSDPDLFEGKRRLYYGRWSYKYEEAARRGAVGAIVIHTTPSAGYPFQVIQSSHEGEEFWLPFEEGQPTLPVRSWCSEDAAKKIASLGGFDLDDLRQKAESREFTPVALGVRASLETENTVQQKESANVLGLLEGSDPKLRDEVVVVTAHFDHLGVGPEKQGDSIYNGGVDNASGAAALLEIADACSCLDVAPRRSILFLSVTAEESGLLGAKYFARHPTTPIKKIVANVNLDSLNVWGATRDIQMVGYGKNSLTDVVAAIAERRGRRLEPNKEVDKGYFYRSDHFAFAKVGVPAVFLEPGVDFIENSAGRARVKSMYTTTRYHQPSDQFDDRWILDGMVEDVRLVLEALVTIANADEAPTWTPGDEFERLR